ncbi:MAG: hypothetical protein PVS3B1_27720 [Ktedonobacteraceae bacterium]
MGESATTEHSPHPYGNQPISSSQPNPYTPIPHTSYSYGPPPPPPDPYNVRPVGPQIPYTPPPVFANRQGQEPPRRKGRGGLIALLLLLIVLLIGGSAFVYFNKRQQENLAHTQATATANAQREATSTAVEQAQAIATAHVQATATAAAANPYTVAGTLLFTDTLKNNSQGHKWDENGNCAFKNGAYHAIAPNPAFGDYCIAQATDVTNFIFEVETKILQGDGAGIDFRSANTETENHYYDFYVFQDGNYSLDVVAGSTSKTLTNGSSVAIKRGLNQTNVLAIVAQGTVLKVYVNHQQVSSVDDSTYKHGPIGVEANPLATGGHQTEVVYSNARVWTL